MVGAAEETWLSAPAQGREIQQPARLRSAGAAAKARGQPSPKLPPKETKSLAEQQLQSVLGAKAAARRTLPGRSPTKRFSRCTTSSRATRRRSTVSWPISTIFI